MAASAGGAGQWQWAVGGLQSAKVAQKAKPKKGSNFATIDVQTTANNNDSASHTHRWMSEHEWTRGMARAGLGSAMRIESLKKDVK